MTLTALAIAALGVLMFLKGGQELDRLQQPSVNSIDADWRAYRNEEAGLLRKVIWGVILVAVGGGLYYFVVPATRLKESLESLQPVTGRSKEEIAGVLGVPGEVERSTDGSVTRETWRTLRFRFTLEFHQGVCAGLVHTRED